MVPEPAHLALREQRTGCAGKRLHSFQLEKEKLTSVMSKKGKLPASQLDNRRPCAWGACGPWNAVSQGLSPWRKLDFLFLRRKLDSLSASW